MWATTASLLRNTRRSPRQIPVLYVLLVVNTAALAYTHFGSAPILLSVYIPGLLCGICALRLTLWLFRTARSHTATEARSQMRKTVVLSGILGLSFGSWAISLYGYGDAYQQSHIAYFMSIAGISCVFCLMSLPPAALITTGAVFCLLIAKFIFTGVPVFVAMSVSVFIVSFAFVQVTRLYFDNFANLVKLSEVMESKQKETEQLNQANIKHAFEDQLTGLANRRKFFDALDAELDRRRGAVPPVVGLVDLDGFKPINDVFGHAAGDAVLIETAKRFRAILPDDATIARLGGDEFGFILPMRTVRTDAESIGLAICHALKDHFVTPAGMAKLSGSCGMTVSNDVTATSHKLLEQADFALYQAKERQHGGVEIFSDRHVQLLEKRTSIERELQVADLREELYIELQPIVCLRDGTSTRFEALGRWHNATLGTVSPGDFIPIAERCGLINDVSLILLRKSLDALLMLPVECKLSFNLSARDICNHVDALKVLSLVERSGVAPSRLEFEITETALLSNFETAGKMISLFRAAGIKIALDDFGTGYSSLSHIHSLSFDKVKIDRSFVQRMTADQRSRNIVKTVVDLCANMQIDCVAEGVETEETAQELVKIGCAMAQGYHFSRPLSIALAVAHAEQGSARLSRLSA
jgi:diguanylate cyclase (GGDEF)-like protein